MNDHKKIELLSTEEGNVNVLILNKTSTHTTYVSKMSFSLIF